MAPLPTIACHLDYLTPRECVPVRTCLIIRLYRGLPPFYCAVYGVPIEDLYWRDGDSFPLLVNVLVELIEEKGSPPFLRLVHQVHLLILKSAGLDQQGIYRVPGEKRVIENLQASIDERGTLIDSTPCG